MAFLLYEHGCVGPIDDLKRRLLGIVDTDAA